MYDPPVRIEKGVYPYIVKWLLSIGYEVNTNEPHTLLYRIICYDGIRAREIEEEGKSNAYTREEAELLVNDLEVYFQEGRKPFTPNYEPPIRILDDFSTNVFLPALTGSGEKSDGYEVKWQQWGIYHEIEKVSRRRWRSLMRGGVDIDSVLDRNAVMALIRSLEYKAVMAPFRVVYNLFKTRGSMYKIWGSQKLENYEAAQELMTREKERHAGGDWRIYADVTDIASVKESLSPTAYVRSEGWLWLWVHHPKQAPCGADYGEQGFYNNLGDLKNDIITIQEQDMYAIFGIYACVHHEPVKEEKKEPSPHWGNT